jgi:hypothetical protein
MFFARERARPVASARSVLKVREPRAACAVLRPAPRPQKEPGCFSPESERGRWRARGAYLKYASTLAAGIAKLSGEKHRAPSLQMLEGEVYDGRRVEREKL